MQYGVPLDYYWGKITPVQLKSYATAYQEKLNDQVKLLDATNHILGGYIRTAISDVIAGKNNYPDEPLTAKRQSTLKRVFTKEETEAYLAERKAQRAKKND